jgi:hypothetical protein
LIDIDTYGDRLAVLHLLGAMALEASAYRNQNDFENGGDEKNMGLGTNDLYHQ